MNNLPYTAETDIDGQRLLTFGTNDGEVKPTAAATDPVIGVSLYIGAVKGTVIDVNIDLHGKVKLGGTVSQGDDLTAGADGCAVKATAGDRIFGMALQDGVADDVIEFLKN